MSLFNWIDYCFIAFFILVIIRGWKNGFIYEICSIISFVIAYMVAISIQKSISNGITQLFNVPEYVALSVGFFLVLMIIEWVIAEFLQHIFVLLPKQFFVSPINKIAGALFASGKYIFICFVLVRFVWTLPLRGTFDAEVKQSYFVEQIHHFDLVHSKELPSFFEAYSTQINQTMTVHPSTSENTSLQLPSIDSKELHISLQDEEEMTKLVNRERTALGLQELTVDDSLVQVARNHSFDMFVNRYFSHKDTHMQSITERAGAMGILYAHIGENLAYSPTVERAHEGLMKSTTHRANILNPQYTRIGIGVVEHTQFGVMITQVFADTAL